jgi:ArsR family transcriptional regulator, arsenate/arsenite/antimonite-responsive transcriptional repressor
MDSPATVRALAALAQETRLAVFRLLVEQGPAGLTPGIVAKKLDLAPATLSFHLKELGNAGLVRARQESRYIHYSADFAAMNGLVAYLTKNCCRASGGCEDPRAPECAPDKASRRSAIGRGRRAARTAPIRRRAP